MYPVLYKIFGIEIYTYGALVALAFLIATVWTLKRAQTAGENPEDYLAGLCWVIVSSLVGARLFYILFFPDVFFTDPMGTLLNQGGLVWYGGVAGVSAAIILYTRLKKMSLWKFSDIIVPPAAVGLAIGRIGCLMAGCCYGGPCTLPWAVQYPVGHATHPMWVHPAQIYESLAMIPLLILLNRSYATQKFHGQTTWLFFILYGLVRFGIEYVRGDRLIWIQALNLSASQVISILGVLLGFGMIWYLKQKSADSSPADVNQDSSAIS